MTSLRKIFAYAATLFLAYLFIVIMAAFTVIIYGVYVQFVSELSIKMFMRFDEGHTLEHEHHGKVQLSQQQQELLQGKNHRIDVAINVAETSSEPEMFVVCIDLKNGNEIRKNSCQTALVPHQSNWIRFVRDLIKSPPIILGLSTQSTQVLVEMFTDLAYTEPITDIAIKIKPVNFKYYDVKLKFITNLTGLSYSLVHWPKMSFIVGVAAIVTFVTIFMALVIFSVYITGRGVQKFRATIFNRRIIGRRSIHA